MHFVLKPYARVCGFHFAGQSLSDGHRDNAINLLKQSLTPHPHHPPTPHPSPSTGQQEEEVSAVLSEKGLKNPYLLWVRKVVCRGCAVPF